MPLSGAIVRLGVAVGYVTLVHYSVSNSVPDSGILPNDDTAEVLAVKADLGGTTLTFVNVYIPLRPPALGTTQLTLMLFWRTVETRWCLATLTPTIPPSSPELEMIGQRPEGRLTMGGGQQFATRCCEPRSPYPTPLFGPALLARCDPSQRASPPRCDMVHPHHPWVWPSPHNHIPLQSRPALTAESSVFHELPQGWLGGLHSRIREEICQYPSTNLLFCQGKSLQKVDSRHRRESTFWRLKSSGKEASPLAPVQDSTASASSLVSAMLILERIVSTTRLQSS